MISGGGGSDTNVYLGPWKPSPAAFAAYADREVALCKALRKRDPRATQAGSLFSLRTWDLAGKAS